jgi:hypothetical protein
VASSWVFRAPSDFMIKRLDLLLEELKMPGAMATAPSFSLSSVHSLIAVTSSCPDPRVAIAQIVIPGSTGIFPALGARVPFAGQFCRDRRPGRIPTPIHLRETLIASALVHHRMPCGRDVDHSLDAIALACRADLPRRDDPGPASSPLRTRTPLPLSLFLNRMLIATKYPPSLPSAAASLHTGSTHCSTPEKGCCFETLQ